MLFENIPSYFMVYLLHLFMGSLKKEVDLDEVDLSTFPLMDYSFGIQELYLFLDLRDIIFLNFFFFSLIFYL